MADARAFLDRAYRYAVVGATVHEEKYGHRVLKDLHDAGLNVVGVNPKYTVIDDIPVYLSLKDVPEKPDVAVVVVPPDAGVSVLTDAQSAGIDKVWFQPGAESDAVRETAKRLGITVMANGSCIMVARRELPT